VKDGGEKSLLLSCVLLWSIRCVFIFTGSCTGWRWAVGVCHGTCQANGLPSTGDLIMADGTGLCGGGQAKLPAANWLKPRVWSQLAHFYLLCITP